jgi:FKBP-type peptidyl-prolyl cis-trans isomerase FkpA
MQRFFQRITFLIPVLAAVFLSSCNDLDIEQRTENMEKEEINKAIVNLTTKGYNVDTTKLGVYYIVLKNGTGQYPQSGDTCDLIYTGFFLNGTIFDASYFHRQDSIWSLVYKKISVVPGFEDAVGTLKKGSESDFLIPSRLGYGSNGTYEIPPWTTLGFTIKMKNIRPAKQV